MAPIIDIIRHAESWEDKHPGTCSMRGPSLTDAGEQQCYKLRRSYPHANKVTHLISSPMWRCVRTAVNAFEKVLNNGHKAILLGELQETGWHDCDTGSPVKALQNEFTCRVDVSGLDKHWWWKVQGSQWEPDVALVEERARQARWEIRRLVCMAGDDARIVVITYGRFVHFLTQDFSGLLLDRFTTYPNLGMRSFECVDLHGTHGDAELVETKESNESSDLPPWASLSEEEKQRLRSYAVERVELQKAD
ncbi:Uu.00g067770.m01.CDS01 [Anthostomella pinea]|uniref:Uu.00g067770.m01.CDS01 n=1 Tax=Anthostomella pinea TaxID=933095 RepID=A0AAI8VU63_9PEZI|nr:Uu.00g067770.m01.CDS01 [Anthostomella pinea]